MAIRGPISRFDRRRVSGLSEVDADGVLTFRDRGAKYLLGEGVWLAVDFMAGIDDPHARFEFSSPRVCAGSNLVPASVEETLDAVDYLVDVASEFVSWSTDPGDLAVTRVDYTTNVQLDPEVGLDYRGLVDLLARRQPRGGMQSTVHLGAKDMYGHSVTWGTDEWRVIVYDKRAEILNRSRRRLVNQTTVARDLGLAEGIVRIETSLRSRELSKIGARSVNGLREGASEVAALARKHVGRIGVDAPVLSESAVISAIRRQLASGQQDVSKTIGLLFLESHGLVDNLAENTRRNRCKRLFEMGLADFTFASPSPSHSVRIDLDSHRVVRLWSDR
ncbi:hypothetical protein BH09ACT11_BH09ACT11_12510 [soil metagenome]